MRRATAEMEDGAQIGDTPKSEAGKHTISLPKGLKADIEVHLTKHAQAGPGGRLFVGPQSGSPRPAMIHQHATRDRDHAIATPWMS